MRIYLVNDVNGKTPLHHAYNANKSRAADKILEAISNDPISNHIDLIRDIGPKLIRTSPQATCKYLDSRMISRPWFLTSTEGDLKKEFYADLLKPID